MRDADYPMFQIESIPVMTTSVTTTHRP